MPKGKYTTDKLLDRLTTPFDTEIRDLGKPPKGFDFSAERLTLLPWDPLDFQNLEAWWKFDETSGTTAADASGNANTGTRVVRHWSDENKIGARAIRFDGFNDYVEIPDTAALNPTDAVTVAAWIKVAKFSVDDVMQVVNKQGNGADAGYRLALQKVTNGYVVEGSTYNGVARECNGSTLIQTGVWTHVAFTFDSTNIKVYVNGVQDGSLTASAMVASSNPLCIGRHKVSLSGWFDGWIDDVRVYSRALSATEIDALYDLNTKSIDSTRNNDDLAAWWKMDETTGNTLADATNHALNGTRVVHHWSEVNKIGDRAIRFDGNNDKIEIPFDAGLRGIASEGSMGAWVKVAKRPSELSTILDPGRTGNDGLVLFVESDGSVKFQYGDGTQVLVAGSTGTLVNGTWYHVFATWDSSGAKLYINGVLDGSNAAAPAIDLSQESYVYIGSQGGTGRFFDGWIDDVRFYSRTLSATEIDALYDLGAGGKTIDSVRNNDGLVAWWKLDESGGTGTEIVTNGGFETWTNGAPDGWTEVNDSDGSVTQETSILRSGSSTVKVTSGTEATLDRVEQNLTTTAGKSYYVEAYARTDGSGRAKLYMTESGGTTVAQVDGTTGTTAWEKLSFTFHAESSVTYAIKCANGGANSTSVYFDDVSIKEITSDDATNNALHGKPKGAVNKAGPTPVVGKHGYALDFDVDDHVRVDNATVCQTEKFSVACWIKTSESSDTRIINFGEDGANEGGWVLGTASTGELRTYIDSGASWTRLDSIATVNDNVWHHIMLTYDGSALRIYVDGSLDNSRSVSNYVHNPTNPIIMMGKSTFDNEHWTGILDDVRIYNRALTAAEVESLYQLSPQNLEGYYEFEETTGVTHYDSSGNGRGGTFSDGGARWVTGKHGNAHHFGGNEYFSVSNNANLNSDYITLAAWVKMDVLDNVKVVEKGNDSYRIEVASTGEAMAQFQLSDGTYIVAKSVSGKITAGTWHHIVAIYDGSEARVYVDGVLEATTAASGTLEQDTGILAIGTTTDNNGYPGSQPYFDGVIDDVRVYTRALTSAEVESLYQLSPQNLEAYYEFEESSGTTHSDSSGNGHSGTFTDGGPQWVAGKHDNAYRLGGNEYFEAPNSASLQLSKEITVSAWVKPDQTFVPEADIVRKGNQYLLRQSRDDYALYIHVAGAWRSIFAVGAAAVDTWSHVVGVYDGAKMRIYVDGVEKNSASLTGVLDDSTGPLRIGHYASDDTFDGIIDEVRVYSRALSAAEVEHLYEATTGDHYAGWDPVDATIVETGDYAEEGGALQITPSAVDATITKTINAEDWSGNKYFSFWVKAAADSAISVTLTDNAGDTNTYGRLPVKTSYKMYTMELAKAFPDVNLSAINEVKFTFHSTDVFCLDHIFHDKADSLTTDHASSTHHQYDLLFTHNAFGKHQIRLNPAKSRIWWTSGHGNQRKGTILNFKEWTCEAVDRQHAIVKLDTGASIESFAAGLTRFRKANNQVTIDDVPTDLSVNQEPLPHQLDNDKWWLTSTYKYSTTSGKVTTNEDDDVFAVFYQPHKWVAWPHMLNFLSVDDLRIGETNVEKLTRSFRLGHWAYVDLGLTDMRRDMFAADARRGALDNWGRMVKLKRKPSEKDTDYRRRIYSEFRRKIGGVTRDLTIGFVEAIIQAHTGEVTMTENLVTSANNKWTPAYFEIDVEAIALKRAGYDPDNFNTILQEIEDILNDTGCAGVRVKVNLLSDSEFDTATFDSTDVYGA